MMPLLLRSSLLWLVVAFVCLRLTGPALAEESPSPRPEIIPLGATPQQVVALYGPVLRHNARTRHHEILEGGTVIDGDLYSRNGLVIRVVYHAGVSVLLEYTRAVGSLTIHDANLLLTANASPSATWEAGKDSTEANRFYHRSDGKALAHYTADDDGSLLIAAENTGTDFYGGKLMESH